MTASTLAWTLYVVTPLTAILFLTTFLVNMGDWGADTWFTRFCRRAQVPVFGVMLVCILLTLRYF
jgi:hypothetical protein